MFVFFLELSEFYSKLPSWRFCNLCDKRRDI